MKRAQRGAALTVALLSATLMGCDAAPEGRLAPSQIDFIESAVRQQLRDPDSAQFRDIKIGTGDDAHFVCGYVNAKNGFGGYIGFTRFMGLYFWPGDFEGTHYEEPEFVPMGIDTDGENTAETMCVKAHM